MPPGRGIGGVEEGGVGPGQVGRQAAEETEAEVEVKGSVGRGGDEGDRGLGRLAVPAEDVLPDLSPSYLLSFL